jgi:hypothetical protein
MYSLSLNPEWLVAAAVAVLSGAVAAILLAMYFGARRRSERATSLLHRELGQLQAETRSQGAALMALASRLDRISAQLETASRQAPAVARHSEAGYELAIRLARSGAAMEELVIACGMSRKEAELVTRMHGRPTQAASPRLAVVS